MSNFGPLHSNAGSVVFGITAGTAVEGNDVRLPPTPTGAGKVIIDTGTAIGETAVGTSGQVLTSTGAADPVWTTLAAAVTVPISEANGGFGSDISALGAGLVTKTAANTYVTRTVASGTGTTVTNGAGTAGNPSVNVTYGTTSNTATQGNDVRLSPTPSGAGKVVYDNGSAYVAATAGTSSQVLLGGAAPAFGNVPAAAIPNTAVSAGSYPTAGQIPTFTVGADGRLTAAGSATSGSGLTSLNASNLTTGVVAETQGGHGSDISGIGTGLVTRTATNTYVTRTLSSGTGTTVTNGAGTAGNPSVNVTYGTTSSTATQGNDTRLPPTPTAAGKVLYDTGSAYAETAAGTSNQILVSAGAGSPTWGTRGGGVINFVLNTGQSFAANGYIGLAGDGSSTVNVNVTPWRVPLAGTLKNLIVYSFTNAPSTLHCLIYKATTAGISPTYSATALDVTVTSGTNIGTDTTNSVSVNAGDLIVAFCNTAWAANGAVISVMYSPT